MSGGICRLRSSRSTANRGKWSSPRERLRTAVPLLPQAACRPRPSFLRRPMLARGMLALRGGADSRGSGTARSGRRPAYPAVAGQAMVGKLEVRPRGRARNCCPLLQPSRRARCWRRCRRAVRALSCVLRESGGFEGPRLVTVRAALSRTQGCPSAATKSGQLQVGPRRGSGGRDFVLAFSSRLVVRHHSASLGAVPPRRRRTRSMTRLHTTSTELRHTREPLPGSLILP